MRTSPLEKIPDSEVATACNKVSKYQIVIRSPCLSRFRCRSIVGSVGLKHKVKVHVNDLESRRHEKWDIVDEICDNLKYRKSACAKRTVMCDTRMQCMNERRGMNSGVY